MTEPKRRATRQVRRLLQIADENYESIVTTKRASEMSAYKNRAKFINTIKDVENSFWVARAILRWVLMESLTAEELKYVPVEMEEELL